MFVTPAWFGGNDTSVDADIGRNSDLNGRDNRFAVLRIKTK